MAEETEAEEIEFEEAEMQPGAWLIGMLSQMLSGPVDDESAQND